MFLLLHLLPEVDHIPLKILNLFVWKGTKPIKGTWKMRACHKVPRDLCLVTPNPILGAMEQWPLMSKRWLESKSMTEGLLCWHQAPLQNLFLWLKTPRINNELHCTRQNFWNISSLVMRFYETCHQPICV